MTNIKDKYNHKCCYNYQLYSSNNRDSCFVSIDNTDVMADSLKLLILVIISMISKSVLNN